MWVYSVQKLWKIQIIKNLGSSLPIFQMEKSIKSNLPVGSGTHLSSLKLNSSLIPQVFSITDHFSSGD